MKLDAATYHDITNLTSHVKHIRVNVSYLSVSEFLQHLRLCHTYWCLPLNTLLHHLHFVCCPPQNPTIQCWQSLDDSIDSEIISVDENIGLAPACKNCNKKEDNHKTNQTVYGKHGDSDGNFFHPKLQI